LRAKNGILTLALGTVLELRYHYHYDLSSGLKS
jgi:hypothetical protein